MLTPTKRNLDWVAHHTRIWIRSFVRRMRREFFTLKSTVLWKCKLALAMYQKRLARACVVLQKSPRSFQAQGPHWSLNPPSWSSCLAFWIFGLLTQPSLNPVNVGEAFPFPFWANNGFNKQSLAWKKGAPLPPGGSGGPANIRT